MWPSKPTHLLKLASGTLAVDEVGDPQGRPVMFNHGWPASRLQVGIFARAARELGLRLIAPDRPGIGASSFVPGRTLRDWPAMVEQMADALALERFAVLGVSGGGPYTLALAHALPERVEGALVVSGAPPMGPELDARELLPLYRWLLAAHQRLPQLSRRLFQAARPVLSIRPPRWSYVVLRQCAPPADRPGLMDERMMFGLLEGTRESWRGSALGVAYDGELYAQEWGFAPEEIRVPVAIWHGKEDTSFHWRMAERLAARIPGAGFRLVEGEGHYSLPVNHRREILDGVLGLVEKHVVTDDR